MARLDKVKIDEIKANVNIVDVISQYVHLSKTGMRYLGLCPFHGEKTPSFNVNAQKQFYHCFGCGKSGDVFRFLEDYKQESFVDAVKEVADFAGMVIEVDDQPKSVNPNQPLFELHTQAARMYHTLLTTTEEGMHARAYLLERGITDEIIQKFQIGLSLNEADFLYQSVKQKYDEAVLTTSGLMMFTENRIFDTFQGRIMFPLRDEHGQVVAFSGRIWRPEDLSNKGLAKYKNSTRTPIFNKSEALYNLDQATKKIKHDHEVYLMEGFMDVIAAYQNGVTNAVASMGTALTDGHIRKLRRLTHRFILVYDGDKAGQAAIFKALSLLTTDHVEVVRIPDGMDPDDYNKAYPNALGELMVNSRMAPVEFLMDYLRPVNLSNLQAQLDFIDQIGPKIAIIDSLTAQDAYIKRLVEILPDFEYNQVESAVNKWRPNVQASQDFEPDFIPFDENMVPPPEEPYDFPMADQLPVVPVATLAVKKYSQIELSELQLLHRMIYHPSVLARILALVDFQFVHKRYQQLFEIMKGLEDVDETRLMAHITGEDSDTFYEILSSVNIPEEISDQEIDDLLKNFTVATKGFELQTLKQQLEQAKQTGNKALELQLTLQIVAQGKQDGV